MDNISKTSEDRQQQYNVQRVVKAEVNLLVFPCFTLYRHSDPLKSISFSSTVQRNGKRYDLEWIVSPNVDFGIPTNFDRRVLRACEFFWSKLSKPLFSPLLVPSARELARLMKVKCSGQFAQRLKLVFRRLQGITLTSHMAAYDKKKKSWIDDSFNLFDRVTLAGKKDDDGNKVKRTLVFPSEVYLGNLNSRYVCPLDYDYLMSLPPVGSRMYELLSVKFYGSPDEHVEYRYTSLCGLLPAEQQAYLSLASQQLNSAHEQLKRTGFLAEYNWSAGRKTKGEWYICYMPGERYRHYEKLFNEKVTAGSVRLLDLPIAQLEAISEEAQSIQEPACQESIKSIIEKPELHAGGADESTAIKTEDVFPGDCSPQQKTEQQSLLPDNLPNVTQDERCYLNLLKTISRYPFDFEKDLAFIRDLLIDFPTVDLIEEIKGWKTWLIDNNPKGNVNYRSRLRRWLKNAMKYEGEKRNGSRRNGKGGKKIGKYAALEAELRELDLSGESGGDPGEEIAYDCDEAAEAW